MSYLSTKFACAACVELLPRELQEVKSKGGPGPCEFCGSAGVGGPLTWPQLNYILDARGLWRPKPGSEGILRQHRSVDEADVGKYVHILRESSHKASVALVTDEPWLEVRIVGAEPPPHQVYPAYPQSAIGPYENTREALLDRKRTLEANIKLMPTAEKLRLAADYLERNLDEIAASVTKLALAEVEGNLPKVPMPEVPSC